MRTITTDASVRATKPNPTRQEEHRVAGVRALSLRVSPNGNKSWTLRYRTRQGEQRRYTIGVYPEIALADARGKAAVILGAVASGTDPAKEARAVRELTKARKMSTVTDLIEGYFEAAENGRHRPNARPKRARTLEDERSHFRRLIKPRFGKRPISELTRSEVQRFADEVAGSSPSTARLCRNLIRQAFNFAIRREVCDRNPAQLTDVPRGDSRERVLTDEELQAIRKATDVVGVPGLHMAPGTRLALRLALLTLQRGGEIVGLHAREVDRKSRIWIIPGVRAKNHCTHVVERRPTQQMCVQNWRGSSASTTLKETSRARPTRRPPAPLITTTPRPILILGTGEAAQHACRHRHR